MDDAVQAPYNPFDWLVNETAAIKREHGFAADAPVFVCIKCRRVVYYTSKNKMSCSCYQQLKESA